MLYKQMQVKEIPIIFRGTVSGGSTIDPNIDETFTTWNPGTEYYKYQTFLGIELFNYDKIYVQFDDDIYVLDRFFNSTLNKNQFGAPFKWTGGMASFDWTDYHFALRTWDSEYSSLDIDPTIASDPHTIKIWYSDPSILIPSKKIFSSELTGNGQIKRFRARFACGENGTLHINPYVILNGNITVNLCDFAKEGENYISGDNEDFTFECYVPIETHAVLYVEAENVGEYASMLDVAIVVQYEDFIEEETIVGYEGINLRRIHR